MSDRLPPVLLVTGTDRFRVMERFATERDRITAAADTGSGVEDFEGDDPETVARALDAARTPSMFGSERVVLLRHGVSEDTIPLLLRYLDDVAEDATLVLMHVRSGRATKAYKQLEAAIGTAGGEVVEEAAPPDGARELAAYVKTVASERGVVLDGEAAAYLASHLGSDAGAIATALDKLAAAHQGTKRLGAEAVSELVGGPELVKMWDLTDAVDAGDRRTALAVLTNLLQTVPSSLQIHGAISSHVRRLLAASELEPASAQQIEAELGIKSYPAKKLFGMVRSVPQPAIVAAHREVAAADVALRGASGLDDVVVLEILVARLSGILGRGRGRRR